MCRRLSAVVDPCVLAMPKGPRTCSGNERATCTRGASTAARFAIRNQPSGSQCAGQVHPELQKSLEECKKAFGGKVCLFSNSAGLQQFDPEGALLRPPTGWRQTAAHKVTTRHCRMRRTACTLASL